MPALNGDVVVKHLVQRAGVCRSDGPLVCCWNRVVWRTPLVPLVACRVARRTRREMREADIFSERFQLPIDQVGVLDNRLEVDCL